MEPRTIQKIFGIIGTACTAVAAIIGWVIGEEDKKTVIETTATEKPAGNSDALMGGDK